MAGPFRFTLAGCRRLNTQVTCEFDVGNTSPDDKKFMIFSKHNGGVGLNAHRVHGLTQALDARGTVYVADRVSLANSSGAETGQSLFLVYSGTKPKLSLVFENLGLSVDRLARLDVKTLVPVGGQGVSGPMSFRDVPIDGGSGAALRPAAAPTSGKFVNESQGWRLALRRCERSGTDLLCTVDVTNLEDRKRTAVLITDDESRHVSHLAREMGNTSIVSDDGSRYPASSHLVDYKEARAATRQQPTFGPYQRSVAVIRFTGVPASFTRIPRLDLRAAALKEDSDNPYASDSYVKIPVRWTGIEISASR